MLVLQQQKRTHSSDPRDLPQKPIALRLGASRRDLKSAASSAQEADRNRKPALESIVPCFQPSLQALATFPTGEGFTRRAAELTGYDASPAGKIRLFT